MYCIPRLEADCCRVIVFGSLLEKPSTIAVFKIENIGIIFVAKWTIHNKTGFVAHRTSQTVTISAVIDL